MFKKCPSCRHRCELPKLFKPDWIGVEVGILQAAYSAELLCRWSGHLHLIDPWEPYPEYKDFMAKPIQDHRHNFKAALKRLTNYNGRFTIWREKSSQSLADRIGMVDFVYVDGNHALEYVADDMHTWWPKINPGGVLAGHDLFQVDTPDVTEVLVLFAKEVGRDVFWVPGRDGCVCGEGGVPSWYLRK